MPLTDSGVVDLHVVFIVEVRPVSPVARGLTTRSEPLKRTSETFRDGRRCAATTVHTGPW